MSHWHRARYVVAISVTLGMAMATPSCGGGDPGGASDAARNEGAFTISASSAGTPHEGANTFRISVHDRVSGAPVVDATLDVVPLHLSMGHASPSRTSTRAVAPGEYDVGPVVFNMPGRWALRIDVSAASRSARAEVLVEVP